MGRFHTGNEFNNQRLELFQQKSTINASKNSTKYKPLEFEAQKKEKNTQKIKYKDSGNVFYIADSKENLFGNLSPTSRSSKTYEQSGIRDDDDKNGSKSTFQYNFKKKNGAVTGFSESTNSHLKSDNNSQTYEKNIQVSKKNMSAFNVNCMDENDLIRLKNVINERLMNLSKINSSKKQEISKRDYDFNNDSSSRNSKRVLVTDPNRFYTFKTIEDQRQQPYMDSTLRVNKHYSTSRSNPHNKYRKSDSEKINYNIQNCPRDQMKHNFITNLDSKKVKTPKSTPGKKDIPSPKPKNEEKSWSDPYKNNDNKNNQEFFNKTKNSVDSNFFVKENFHNNFKNVSDTEKLNEEFETTSQDKLKNLRKRFLKRNSKDYKPEKIINNSKNVTENSKNTISETINAKFNNQFQTNTSPSQQTGNTNTNSISEQSSQTDNKYHFIDIYNKKLSKHDNIPRKKSKYKDAFYIEDMNIQNTAMVDNLDFIYNDLYNQDELLKDCETSQEIIEDFNKFEYKPFNNHTIEDTIFGDSNLLKHQNNKNEELTYTNAKISENEKHKEIQQKKELTSQNSFELLRKSMIETPKNDYNILDSSNNDTTSMSKLSLSKNDSVLYNEKVNDDFLFSNLNFENHNKKASEPKFKLQKKDNYYEQFEYKSKHISKHKKTSKVKNSGSSKDQHTDNQKNTTENNSYEEDTLMETSQSILQIKMD